MKTFKKIIPFIIIALVFAVLGFFVGQITVYRQEASLYKTPSTIQYGGYKWVCEGMQGCICYTDGGSVADRTRQINEKSCLAKMVPWQNSTAGAR